jgi:ferredoxin-like protein FixX
VTDYTETEHTKIIQHLETICRASAICSYIDPDRVQAVWPALLDIVRTAECPTLVFDEQPDGKGGVMLVTISCNRCGTCKALAKLKGIVLGSGRG